MTFSIKSILGSLMVIAIFLLLSFYLKGTIHRNPMQTLGQASFGSGIIHGALMPLALVPILANQDIPIYEVFNNGTRYHLGYILGVNLCGLVFIPPMVKGIWFMFGLIRRRK